MGEQKNIVQEMANAIHEIAPWLAASLDDVYLRPGIEYIQACTELMRVDILLDKIDLTTLQAWNDINEIQPEIDEEVIIFCDGNILMGTPRMSKDVQFLTVFDEAFQKKIESKTTHWMHKPAPPKGSIAKG